MPAADHHKVIKDSRPFEKDRTISTFHFNHSGLTSVFVYDDALDKGADIQLDHAGLTELIQHLQTIQAATAPAEV